MQLSGLAGKVEKEEAEDKGTAGAHTAGSPGPLRAVGVGVEGAPLVQVPPLPRLP